MQGRISASIGEDLEKRLNIYLSKHPKEYEGVSDFMQQRIIEFLEPNESRFYLQVAMMYLGYPLLIGVALLAGFVASGNIYFMYANGLVIGLTFAGAYVLFTRHRGKK